MLGINRLVYIVVLLVAEIYADEKFRIAHKFDKALSTDGEEKPCNPPVELYVDSKEGTLTGDVSPKNECGALALSVLRGDANLRQFKLPYRQVVDGHVRFKKCLLNSLAFDKQSMTWSMNCDVERDKPKFGALEGIFLTIFLIALVVFMFNMIQMYTPCFKSKIKTLTGSGSADKKTSTEGAESGATAGTATAGAETGATAGAETGATAGAETDVTPGTTAPGGETAATPGTTTPGGETDATPGTTTPGGETDATPGVTPSPFTPEAGDEANEKTNLLSAASVPQ